MPTDDPALSGLLGGDAFAARGLDDPQKLYSGQLSALESIIKVIYRVGYREASVRDSRVRPSVQSFGHYPVDHLEEAGPAAMRRPAHVVVVDGARGVGKTTLLLTLQACLAHLHLKSNSVPFPHTTGRDRAGAKPPRFADYLDRILDGEFRADRPTRVALNIPVIFPDSLETGETTMEALFGLIENLLEERRTELDKGRLGDGERQRQLKRIDELIDKLHHKVAVAWTFSRGIGAEALHSNSLNYEDFVVQRAHHNRLAYTRVEQWHRFVDELLDFFDIELLVPCFDDTDLLPRAGEDILHAIRIYLNHPRIVTVLAVNMDSLHRIMTFEAYQRFGESLRAMDAVSHLGGVAVDLARARVRHIEKDVNAFITKVLPPPLRHRLAFSSLDDINAVFGRRLDDFVRDRMAAELKENRRHALEWWLVRRAPYLRLPAFSVRELLSFRTLAESEPKRCLSEMLFSVAAARQLYERAGGSLDALSRLLLVIVQRGRLTRSLDQDLDDDDYLYRFIDFWLDANLAAGTMSPQHLDLMEDVLSAPPAIGWDASGGFIDRNQASEGVASRMQGRAMPRNVRYLADLYPLGSFIDTPLDVLIDWLHLLRDELSSSKRIPLNFGDAVRPSDNREAPASSLTVLFAEVIDRLKTGRDQVQASAAMLLMWRLWTAGPDADVSQRLNDKDAKLFAEWWNGFWRRWASAELDRRAAVRVLELAARVAVDLFPDPRLLSTDPVQVTTDVADKLAVATAGDAARDALLLAWAALPPLEFFTRYRLTAPDRGESGVAALAQLANAMETVAARVAEMPRFPRPDATGYDPGCQSHAFPDFTPEALDGMVAAIRAGAAEAMATLRRRMELAKTPWQTLSGVQVAAAMLGVGEEWLSWD